MMPLSCASMWSVRIGDSPTRMPATNAPSTECTPSQSVISDISPMMTRMTVMTAYSLRMLSLVQRIAVNTSRRPMVKLNVMKAATPSTVPASGSSFTPPSVAMPKVTAMISQPIVSSMIADEMMTCPRLRRRKPISRTITSTIFTDEIDSAVPRNRPATI